MFTRRHLRAWLLLFCAWVVFLHSDMSYLYLKDAKLRRRGNEVTRRSSVWRVNLWRQSTRPAGKCLWQSGCEKKYLSLLCFGSADFWIECSFRIQILYRIQVCWVCGWFLLKVGVLLGESHRPHLQFLSRSIHSLTIYDHICIKLWLHSNSLYSS